MGAHLNSLAEAILMSTHDIGFYEDLTKIIFELSLNYHQIRTLFLLLNNLTLWNNSAEMDKF